MDFFLLGVTVLVTGLLGLPASSGLIPQNPMHSKALVVTPSSPSERPYVVEQRISNMIHSGLLLLILLVLPVVSYIPTGVLWGAFFLLAVEASEAQFVRRCLLFITSEKVRKGSGREGLEGGGARCRGGAKQHYVLCAFLLTQTSPLPTYTTQSKYLPGWDDLRSIIDNVPGPVIHKFTAIQFLLWAVIFVTAVILKIPYPMNDGNTWVVIGSLFPVMICLCAVIRFTSLKRAIPEAYLDLLDPHENHGRLQEIKESPTQEKDPDIILQNDTPSEPSSSTEEGPFQPELKDDEKSNDTSNDESNLKHRQVNLTKSK